MGNALSTAESGVIYQWRPSKKKALVFEGASGECKVYGPANADWMAVIDGILTYPVDSISTENDPYDSVLWRDREAEADDDIAAGRYSTFLDSDDFLNDLDD